MVGANQCAIEDINLLPTLGCRRNVYQNDIFPNYEDHEGNLDEEKGNFVMEDGQTATSVPHHHTLPS